MIDPFVALTGILFALIATVCFNLAIVYQKKGLNIEPDIDIEGGVRGVIASFKKLFKNRNWLIGTLLGFIGWPFFFFSVAMVGVIVTEPIMASGFLVFVIAAVTILKEKIKPLEYFAIGLLTISPIMIAFAGISNVIFNFEEIYILLIIFLAIAISITLICLVLSKKTRDKSIGPVFMMFTGAILFALGGVFTNILAQAIIAAELQLTWYILFEIVFAIFWFDMAHLWIFIGFWGMVIMNITSMPYYQGAIQKGKATDLYPVLDTIALLVPVMAGIFVFQQTFANYSLFLIAMIFVVIGTLILSRFQAEIERIGLHVEKEEEKDQSMEIKKSSGSLND